jgi:hypothetical protein
VVEIEVYKYKYENINNNGKGVQEGGLSSTNNHLYTHACPGSTIEDNY